MASNFQFKKIITQPLELTVSIYANSLEEAYAKWLSGKINIEIEKPTLIPDEIQTIQQFKELVLESYKLSQKYSFQWNNSFLHPCCFAKVNCGEYDVYLSLSENSPYPSPDDKVSINLRSKYSDAHNEDVIKKLTGSEYHYFSCKLSEVDDFIEKLEEYQKDNNNG